MEWNLISKVPPIYPKVANLFDSRQFHTILVVTIVTVGSWRKILHTCWYLIPGRQLIELSDTALGIDFELQIITMADTVHIQK